MRKTTFACIVAFTVFGMGATAHAEPKAMPDGTVFDAEYYAEAYPDVATVCGNDEAALYNHYVTYGKSEGRLPMAPGTEMEAESVQQFTSALPVTEESLKAAAALHNYYKGIPGEMAAEADAVAKKIADFVILNFADCSDRAKVHFAAQIVACYCDNAMYGEDEGRVYYRSPAGVFVTGNYTCAGAARAMGRVLDYMGFSWQHAHENEYDHQWCIATMDGLAGYADGSVGCADYGDMEDGVSFAAAYGAAMHQYAVLEMQYFKAN